MAWHEKILVTIISINQQTNVRCGIIKESSSLLLLRFYLPALKLYSASSVLLWCFLRKGKKHNEIMLHAYPSLNTSCWKHDEIMLHAYPSLNTSCWMLMVISLPTNEICSMILYSWKERKRTQSQNSVLINSYEVMIETWYARDALGSLKRQRHGRIDPSWGFKSGSRKEST
jgi:hypothetical protein